jgi:hypothetical protein
MLIRFNIIELGRQFILRVAVSDLSRDPDWGFSLFHSVSPGKFCNIVSNYDDGFFPPRLSLSSFFKTV